MLKFITQPLYVWSILLIKVSIVFCLLRFAPSKVFSRFLWGLMIFFIITASLYLTAEMLQCQPLSTIWEPLKKGTCFSPLAIRAAAYANNCKQSFAQLCILLIFYEAISLTIDLLLATLPIPMIWNVQVEMHVKVTIGFAMSLGALEVFFNSTKCH